MWCKIYVVRFYKGLKEYIRLKLNVVWNVIVFIFDKEDIVNMIFIGRINIKNVI